LPKALHITAGVFLIILAIATPYFLNLWISGVSIMVIASNTTSGIDHLISMLTLILMSATTAITGIFLLIRGLKTSKQEK
jgi:hypothetical protein